MNTLLQASRFAGITIQKAEIQDAEALIEIKKRAFAAEFAIYKISPPHFDSLPHQRNAIEQGLYFKILKDGILVGGSGVRGQGNGHFYIGSLYIDPPYQQKGLGTIALRLIERAFPDARTWSLDTPYLSLSNQRFFANSGYAKVGECHPEYAADEAFILFRFEKIIAGNTVEAS